MKIYLLYCPDSFEDKLLARQLETLGCGGLKAISITSEESQKLLEQVFPKGWKYRPYLVRVHQNKVFASTGYEMFLYLKILLGSQKGWQVYSLVQKYGIKLRLKGKHFTIKSSTLK